MSREYKKYRKEDRERVIELLKDNFSLFEIVAITGFSRKFTGGAIKDYNNLIKHYNNETNPIELITDIQKRKNFNKAFNLPIADKPTLIDKKRFRMQHDLMHEELTEYRDACEDLDIIEVADALTDMQEILYGMFAEHGMLDLHSDLYNEVHLSNMSKLNSDGKPIYRADGKVMKSNLFVKPNIAKVLGDEQ